MTKKTKYEVHNTTQNTKDRETRIPQKKTGVHTGASKGETVPALLVTPVVHHVSL